VKIAHVYAGVVNDPITTFDDINRHCISLWADLCFCEDEQSRKLVESLWIKINKLTSDHWENHTYNVGITHLDDLEIDESLVPNEPYDLVLYNPVKYDLNGAEFRISEPERKMIAIGPNPDPNPLKEFVEYTYDNVPQPQFFGLLKNCERFITNSSAAYYEAPYFLKPEQIILIGNRNKNRSTPKTLETGASDKIVKILKEFLNIIITNKEVKKNDKRQN